MTLTFWVMSPTVCLTIVRQTVGGYRQLLFIPWDSSDLVVLYVCTALLPDCCPSRRKELPVSLRWGGQLIWARRATLLQYSVVGSGAIAQTKAGYPVGDRITRWFYCEYVVDILLDQFYATLDEFTQRFAA